jgi:hypothetical protein
MAPPGQHEAKVCEELYKQSAAMDILIKVFCGAVRLLHLYRPRSHLAALSSSLIDCRVLINQFRWSGTLRWAIDTVSNPMDLKLRQAPLLFQSLQMLTPFLRLGEQLNGDAMYWAAHFFRKWDRDNLLFRYRFFKFWANFTSGVVEAFLLGTAIRATDESIIAVIRAVLEMIVYAVWLPKRYYNPKSVVTLSSGFLSAVLGLYVIWKKTNRKVLVADAAPPAGGAPSSSLDKKTN